MIDQTIEEIREMRSHSSSVVAVKATRSLGELLDRRFETVDDFERDLEHNAGALRRANPSHASLHNAMREVVGSVMGEANTVEGGKAVLEDAIDRVAEDVERGKREAGANAAKTFEDGETFLTHDYSSTVLDGVEGALDDGKELTVYATEARPRYLGRKAARTFSRLEGIETHLMVDGAAGHFLPEVDRVVIGMDCIVNDTLYNRVGTLPLVATANQLGVPVTVVGSGAKVITEGFRFENEIRSSAEVILEPVEDIIVENPAYDATPIELITDLVTDEGVRQP